MWTMQVELLGSIYTFLLSILLVRMKINMQIPFTIFVISILLYLDTLGICSGYISKDYLPTMTYFLGDIVQRTD